MKSKILFVVSKMLMENLVTVSWEDKRHKSPKEKEMIRRKKEGYKKKII